MSDPKTSSAVATVPRGEGAVTKLNPIEVLLTEWPADRFNRVVVVDTIRMPSDLMVPVFQVVQMEPADNAGKSPDHYKSSDVPAGHRALTARGINKLVTAAGVNFFDERRLEDGRDPDVMGVTVMAELLLPTGLPFRAPGSQLINLKTWFSKQSSEQEIAKFRKQFYANVSTRARNRAARGILSLKSAYTDREIAKPFAVVSYALNDNHPDVRARRLDNLLPAIHAGYGPGSGQRQLAAGRPIEAVELPEAPDDDVIEGQSREAGNDEPDWFGATTSKPAAAEPTTPKIIEVLRQKAETSGLQGEITDAQKPHVQAAFRGAGGDDPIPFPVVAAGLKALWGVEQAPDGRLPLSAGQAQAIINASVDDDFRRMWVEAFGSAA